MGYPLEVMLVRVRWYAAYPLSFRNIEEMMADEGFSSITRRGTAPPSVCRRYCVLHVDGERNQCATFGGSTKAT